MKRQKKKKAKTTRNKKLTKLKPKHGTCLCKPTPPGHEPFPEV